MVFFKRKIDKIKSQPKKLVKSKKIIPALVLFVLFSVTVFLAFTQTYTWLHGENQASNIFYTPTVKLSVEEDFPDPTVKWGEKQEKKVRFKNEGEASVLLRASYAESWKIPNNTDTDTVLSNTVNGQPLAMLQWTENGFENQSLWQFNEEDGWYYYKKVLPQGESTSDILQNVEFPSDVPEDYIDADYSLYFRVEACQYSSQADNENQKAVRETFARTYEMDENGTLTWSSEPAETNNEEGIEG